MAHVEIKLGTATVKMTGIEFLIFGERYLLAEEALGESDEEVWFDPIPYQLLCQSLELHLKAFIWLCDDLPRNKFRGKYGHDLSKMWMHAKSRGVGKYCTVTKRRNESIEFLSPFYKERKFSYLDLSMSWEGIPALRKNRIALPTIRRLCTRLQQSLKTPVLSAS